jgi:hypothetical protein
VETLRKTVKMAVKPGMVLYVRNLILRGICVVYLIAFLNFYYQAQGKISRGA